MSNVASDPEVEGVMSSIRRLVGASRVDRPMVLVPDEPELAKDDKIETLVLSEAKRVVPLQPGIPVDPEDTFLLTSQFRVDTPSNVLQLRPDQKVGGSRSELTEKAPEPSFGATGAQTADPDTPQTDRQPARNSQKVQDLIAKITALETAIALSADQWEPDDAGRDAYAGTPSSTMEWREDIALDGTGAPVGMADATQTFEPTPQDNSEEIEDEQVIDEAALRRLVAEVVREELQGEIGQRMSRNIRKLIRQEINRALAAEQLT